MKNFQDFSQRLAAAVLEYSPASIETVKDLRTGQTAISGSVEETRQQLVAKLGENITVRRFARIKKPGDGAPWRLPARQPDRG